MPSKLTHRPIELVELKTACRFEVAAYSHLVETEDR